MFSGRITNYSNIFFLLYYKKTEPLIGFPADKTGDGYQNF